MDHRVTFITPVGPGHARYALELARTTIGCVHKFIDDTAGRLGRSRARNQAIRGVETEWTMFLDADDEVHSQFHIPKSNAPILLGIKSGQTSKGGRIDEGPCPRQWTDMLLQPIPRFCISALFRTEILQNHRFMEDMDVGEEIEFILSLAAQYDYEVDAGYFTYIRTDRPSATGPRGYEELDWAQATFPIRQYWALRGRVPLPPEERKIGYWL